MNTRTMLVGTLVMSVLGWAGDALFLRSSEASAVAEVAEADGLALKPEKAAAGEGPLVALRTTVASRLREAAAGPELAGGGVEDGFGLPQAWKPVVSRAPAARPAPAPAIPQPPPPTSQLNNVCAVVEGKVVPINGQVGEWKLIRVDDHGSHFEHARTGTLIIVTSAVQASGEGKAPR